LSILPGPDLLDAAAVLALADRIDTDAAEAARAQLQPVRSRSEQHYALGVLACAAWPAVAANALQAVQLLEGLPLGSFTRELAAGELRGALQGVELTDEEQVQHRLRWVARQHKLRLALRELLPARLGGAELQVTARELSDLADALVQLALDSARAQVEARHGPGLLADGTPSSFVVLGMGKLAGRELNAGSDIDLVYVYDSDDGEAGPRASPITLHEYWARVARKLTSLLDEATADGMAWRVDLRLRPEGRSGPVVNSLPAMLRYYETWGRLWERAALMRARPIAGDEALGTAVLAELEPFVFRKHVQPSIAVELLRLVERSRAEVSVDATRDLKLGLGGIRELEMFVQILQLVWGGTVPQVRARPTLEGLRKLWTEGLVTSRESEELTDGWYLLRRAEHMVQHATGLQTHLLPADGKQRGKLARSLGFEDLTSFDEALVVTRNRVHARLLALSPQQVTASRWERVLQALDGGDEAPLLEALEPWLGALATRELARDVLALARRPDGLLGSLTREREPSCADTVLDSLVEAADPEQAARYLRSFFARARSPEIQVSLMAGNPRAARRFISVLGASAFVGDVVVRRPELGEQVPFSPGMPSLQRVRSEVRDELAAAARWGDDPEEQVGALRRARLRVTMEVALADIGGEVELADVQRVLTELADASVEQALLMALEGQAADGFSVVGIGKYGACELGYGSDLDVFFVFDPERVQGGTEAIGRYIRLAQRTIRLLSVPHVEGPGYELDARLRPSGSQGVLVSSLPSFARYHGLSSGPPPSGPGAAAWERQALIRARACAGDPALGATVLQLAHTAAYELGAPDPAETRRLRLRLQHEVGRERGGRRDIKVGHGGLLDIEFAVQVMQMRHGADARVRVAPTLQAIERLQEAGYLGWEDALTLREGYLFLRKLEQRLHIVHATSMNLLEDSAPGLVPLARRMGLHSEPSRAAHEQLMDRYRAITEAVRAVFLRLVGDQDPAVRP
jgi:glutamate-ammonia-ligase adenylyltransferase